MTTLAVFIGVIALGIALWQWGKRPAVYRSVSRDRLEVLAKVLLNQGYDGGALFLRGRKDVPFLQVMKYIGRDRTGLQLDFPKARWAEPYLQKVETALAQYEPRTTGGWGPHGNDLQFITVDFRTDATLAAQCMADLYEQVLSLDLTESKAHFVRVSADPEARIGL